MDDLALRPYERVCLLCHIVYHKGNKVCPDCLADGVVRRHALANFARSELVSRG